MNLSALLGFIATTGSLSLVAAPVFAQPAPAEPAPLPAEPLPVAPLDTEPPVEPTPAPAELPPAEPAPAPADIAPPVEPTADVGATDAAAEMMAEAQAAEIENQLAMTGDLETDEYKLDIYGFVDFTYGYAVKNFALDDPYDSFAVGRFNVYLASQLGDNWNSLAEVRFTYLPHGSTTISPTGTVARTDTTANDYSDLNRPIQWGGIVIERAWLEYNAHPLLNVRMGHWLTPYGIWNVDHGSPVIVGVRRPFIVGEALLPESQTGLELHGAHNLEPFKLGYHLTLSNGRGPVDQYSDMNDNKAIGGRVFARADMDVTNTLTLGFSGYRGQYTDRTQQFTVTPEGVPAAQFPRVTEYMESSLAADVKWEWSGFLLQSEAIMNDIVYDDLRAAAFAVPPAPPGFVADTRRLGVYGLTGYRFDFGGIMPFAGLEYYDNGAILFGKSAAFWGGLNVRPTPRVVLKAQYTYSWFPDDDLPDNYHFNSVDLQAAWSF